MMVADAVSRLGMKQAVDDLVDARPRNDSAVIAAPA